MEAKSGMLPRYVGSGQAVAALMSVAARMTQSLIYNSEAQSGFSVGGCSGQLFTKHSRGWFGGWRKAYNLPASS